MDPNGHAHAIHPLVNHTDGAAVLGAVRDLQ